MLGHDPGLRVSLALSLVAMIMVAIAENGRIPVDNPATRLELTMVHEAMVLEYSGRHLALIEWARSPQALHVPVADRLHLRAVRHGARPAPAGLLLAGLAAYLAKLAVWPPALVVFETSIAKMRVFRVGEFLGGALMLGFLGTLLLFVSRACEPQPRLRHRASAGRRHGPGQLHAALPGPHVRLIHAFTLHALVLALAVAWQAHIQEAPHLYVTAGIALVFKAIVIPLALHQIVVPLGIQRQIEKAVGTGMTMLAGLGLTALAILVAMPVTADADALAREDIAFGLAVLLLGLLMMITRRNAVSQLVGFMSLENGLILAATGATACRSWSSCRSPSRC